MDIGTKLRLAFLVGLAVVGSLIGFIGLAVQLTRRVPRQGRDRASALTASLLVPRERRSS